MKRRVDPDKAQGGPGQSTGRSWARHRAELGKAQEAAVSMGNAMLPQHDSIVEYWLGSW